MSRPDEEWVRQEFERRHPGIKFPPLRSSYLVDIEGNVYKQAASGGWRATGRKEDSAAVKLQNGFPPVYQAKAVTGQPLYEDPGLKTTIRLVPDLSPPVQLKSDGLGAMGCLGIVGFLAVIGVVIWLIVAHLTSSSGYPPSRTLIDSPDPAGARSVSDIAFSPDGKELATADSYSGANLFDVASGNLVYTFNTSGAIGGTVATTRIAFSPNGELLAAGDSNGDVFVLNIARKRQIAEFTDPQANGFSSPNEGGVYGLAFTPDGKTLAAAEYSGKVHLWDVTRRREFATLSVPSNDSGGQAGYMAFSRHGRILAVGDSDGTTYLWNVARRSRIAILSYHNSPPSGISGVAFSPNGHTLATLGATTVLWNVSTRNMVGTLSAVDSGLNDCSIAFSPTGKTLAAGCNGGSTHLWDVASKQQIATVTGPTGNIDGVAFSPDGNTLAAGSDKGYIYLWNVNQLGNNK